MSTPVRRACASDKYVFDELDNVSMCIFHRWHLTVLQAEFFFIYYIYVHIYFFWTRVHRVYFSFERCCRFSPWMEFNWFDKISHFWPKTTIFLQTFSIHFLKQKNI